MVVHRAYYHFKPFLPWRVRLALRRISASAIRGKSSGIWPINVEAGRKPKAWPGWPENKRFAFVLTHDVEGKNGLSKCHVLSELEAELGFCSSFNLIPEGPYDVSETLRRDLQKRGFEIGVHDLKHDGKLYHSKKSFIQHAERINQYLKMWNVTGFRSGFMLRQLDWLHELKIQYDSSTFDTDPFEPQPDGAHTIFPFWVESPETERRLRSGLNPNQRGYVELPYTLPQDSTLFIILRESTTEIWKKKLDWIVEKGGMALLDTHPDYMSFKNIPRNRIEYPAQFYQEFLDYVKTRYHGEYWHALPQQVASWVRIGPQRLEAPH